MKPANAPVADALRFLLARSLANRLRRRLAQLRRPRYVVALLLGIGYFALIFWPGVEDPPIPARETHFIAALVITLFLAWSWLWGGHRNALALSPAETHLLLPAPLSRRALIAFKLMRVQPAILFSALMFTLVTQGRGPPWWLRLPALYVLLATMNLHQTAASLVHAAAEEQGRAGVRRNRVAIALFSSALLLLGSALVSSLPLLRAASDGTALIDALAAALREPAARVALLPVRLVLEPTFATSAGAWARAMGPALLVLALHVVWVFRTDAAFEEAAVEAGRRRAARVLAVRQGRRLRSERAGRRPRRSLPMPSLGPAAVALVWKNALTFGRSMRGTSIALLAILAMAFFVATGITAESAARMADAVAMTALPLAALITVMGPLVVRNDLRHDLARLDLLRTYPLRGRSIVAAEVASSALTVTTLQLIVLLVGLIAAARGERVHLQGALPALAFIAALVALPPLNGLATSIQNALALLFPAWVRIGDVPPGGVEFMGQQLLALLGAVVLLGLGVLVPLLAGGAIYALLSGVRAVAAGAAVLVFAALVTIEVVLLIVALGRMFDRTDPVEAGIASA